MQWLKIYRGFSSDPKFGLVAFKLGVPRATVNAIAIDLLEFAGAQLPRGDVTYYDVEEAAFNLGLEQKVIDDVLRELALRNFCRKGTIQNWEKYQSSDRTNAERQKRHREKKAKRNAVTKRNALPNTEKKEREKEGKTDKAPKFELPDWIPEKSWRDYNDMRNRKKKPMTARAKELAVKKLEGFKQRGIDIVAVLEQSTFHAWDGLFEPKGIANATSGGGNSQGNKSDRARAAIIGDAQRRGDVEGGQ